MIVRMKTGSLIFLMVYILFSTSVFSQTGDDSQMDVLIRKMFNSEDHSQFDTFFIYHDSAVQLAKETRDPLQMAYLMKIKGTVFIRKEKFDSAMHYLNDARTRSEQLENDTLWVSTVLNIGYVMHRQGNTDSAEYLYKKCLEKSEAYLIPGASGDPLTC